MKRINRDEMIEKAGGIRLLSDGEFAQLVDIVLWEKARREMENVCSDKHTSATISMTFWAAGQRDEKTGSMEPYNITLYSSNKEASIW